MLISQYYEEIGKPTPKAEVMKYLKSQEYTDAKEYAGECESVVMIAKGQSKRYLHYVYIISLKKDKYSFGVCLHRYNNAGVQGTCKYGTRVDYILSSANAPYKFVPGSYSVVSSKGTSDHHIVKVDMIKVGGPQQCMSRKSRQNTRRTIKITHSSSPSKGIWKLHS